MDDFQSIVENLIEEVKTDLVSFNTDYNIYYKEEILSEYIFSKLLSEPYSTSYRVYISSNQNDYLKLKIVNNYLV